MTIQILDQVTELPCGSTIQYGPYNDRIYLMKLGDESPDSLPTDLIDMAIDHEYSKIFVKVPLDSSRQFVKEGYVEEASIPGFYNGDETGTFLGYYLSENRAEESDAEVLDAILDLAFDSAENPITSLDTDRFALRPCCEGDVEEMAAVYRSVFQTYPFPIQDPAYLLDTMQSHVDYFGIEREGELIALSSAEMDPAAYNAEMTDFATIQEWRGHSLGICLLRRMEKEIKRKGIKTAYTIARAKSAAMNITFSKLGYNYGGRLINNTNVSGDVESMNIWYKMISEQFPIH